MSQTARCKFAVSSVTDHGKNQAKGVKLHTQYDQSIPEDVAFTKFTPSGEMNVQIANPAVLEFLKPGAVVYIDITLVTPAPE